MVDDCTGDMCPRGPFSARQPRIGAVNQRELLQANSRRQARGAGADDHHIKIHRFSRGELLRLACHYSKYLRVCCDGRDYGPCLLNASRLQRHRFDLCDKTPRMDSPFV